MPTHKWALNRRAQHGVRVYLGVLSAWFFLNVFINLNYPAPLPSPFLLLIPSLEVWGVLLLLSLTPRITPPLTKGLYFLVLVFLIGIRLFRAGDVLIPVYFNRPFNLYIDSRYIPDLLDLLWRSFSAGILFGIMIAVVIGLALICWWLWLSVRTIHRAFAQARLRRVFWALTAIQAFWVAAFIQGVFPDKLPPPATACTPRLLEEIRFIATVEEVRHKNSMLVNGAAASATQFRRPLDLLHNADVYIFIIESYGTTLYDSLKHTEHFLPVAAAFDATLQKAGLKTYSSVMLSPTFGGASWLAFGTLESGVWLPDQLRYNYLLTSSVTPMATFFNRAGYRSISVMPGTTLPWPEGGYFGYSRLYYAKDFNYRGPPYGWSPMPDQFVLHAIHTREVQKRDRPLFIRYVLTSTHAPFHRQPRYIKDWRRIGDGSVYHQQKPLTFPNNWPDLTDSTEAYLTAMTYEFTVLQNYLVTRANDEALWIILGDHQPNAHISGAMVDASVPIHVISRGEHLLEPFYRSGYTPGMIPHIPPEPKRMDGFLSAFLSAFSSERK
jgi:hypothetical protein